MPADVSRLSFFDDVAAVGRDLLRQMAGDTSPPASRYLALNREIYRQLADVHDLIIDVTIEAEESRTLEAARSALRSLDHEALEGVFRVKRWCDEFERLGNELAMATQDLGLAADDNWQAFTQALQDREAEVAMLYEASLWSLRDDARSCTTLDELRMLLSETNTQLLRQRAEFDGLSRRAATLLRQR